MQLHFLISYCKQTPTNSIQNFLWSIDSWGFLRQTPSQMFSLNPPRSYCTAHVLLEHSLSKNPEHTFLLLKHTSLRHHRCWVYHQVQVQCCIHDDPPATVHKHRSTTLLQLQLILPLADADSLRQQILPECTRKIQRYRHLKQKANNLRYFSSLFIMSPCNYRSSPTSWNSFA